MKPSTPTSDTFYRLLAWVVIPGATWSAILFLLLRDR